MNLVTIYRCFGEETRLRILHLLTRGPLCVCHFQGLLDVPQVKVSQHLAYLKRHGLVTATRHANWMIYSLPKDLSPEFKANLRCLEECAPKQFRSDLKKLKAVRKENAWVVEALVCSEGKCAEGH